MAREGGPSLSLLDQQSPRRSRFLTKEVEPLRAEAEVRLLVLKVQPRFQKVFGFASVISRHSFCGRIKKKIMVRVKISNEK